MKRLDTPKRCFTFTIGSDPTIYCEDDLVDHPELATVYDNWLTSQMDYERDWRDYELSKTDYMMLSDAEYQGVPLPGTTQLQDILDYRAALKLYDLRTQSRPDRPVWYTK